MGPWGIAIIIGVVALGTKGGRAYLKRFMKIGAKAESDVKGEARKVTQQAGKFKDKAESEIKEGSHAGKGDK
jgi:hypothetical protein